MYDPNECIESSLLHLQHLLLTSLKPLPQLFLVSDEQKSNSSSRMSFTTLRSPPIFCLNEASKQNNLTSANIHPSTRFSKRYHKPTVLWQPYPTIDTGSAGVLNGTDGPLSSRGWTVVAYEDLFFESVPVQIGTLSEGELSSLRWTAGCYGRVIGKRPLYRV